MEAAMVQKLLTRPRKARHIMAADQAVERLLPVQSQTLQPFKKVTIDKRLGHDAVGVDGPFTRGKTLSRKSSAESFRSSLHPRAHRN